MRSTSRFLRQENGNEKDGFQLQQTRCEGYRGSRKGAARIAERFAIRGGSSKDSR